MTWLIAEDDADIRTLVATMIQVWGYEPLTFETGQRVWDWLDTLDHRHDATPELVVMDIRMPGKRGNEIAQRMRSFPQFARTPIVLMTAYSLSERERNEMMTVDGVDYILNKPLPDFEQLHTILHEIVKQKRKQNGV